MAIKVERFDIPNIVRVTVDVTSEEWRRVVTQATREGHDIEEFVLDALRFYGGD